MRINIKIDTFKAEKRTGHINESFQGTKKTVCKIDLKQNTFYHSI